MVRNLVNFIILLFYGIFFYENPFSYLSHFNSKTAYRNSNLTEYYEDSDPLNQCKLIHVNIVFRHGTRFPSARNIVNMENVYKKLNSSQSTNNLLNEFLYWKVPFLKREACQLTSVGIQEMMGLGLRFRKLFSKNLTNEQIKKNIKIFSTSFNRSKISGKTFLRMFLNTSKNAEDVDKMIIEDDDLLRFFDRCLYYKVNVAENKEMKREYVKFIKGSAVKSLVTKINKYLQRNTDPLTAEDLMVIYSTCGFEIATNSSSNMKPLQCPVKNGLVYCENSKIYAQQTSPHCSLFDELDFSILEYLFDLKHYWLKSYGKSITRLMGCNLMSSINQQINENIEDHKSAGKLSNSTENHFPKGIFWFSHAETILPLVALLGLFNQTIPMTSDSFTSRLSMIDNPEYRFFIFRTANIVPFAANLGIHVYHCPNLSKNDSSAGYQVRLKMNEKTVPWPLTNGQSHISLSEFEKRIQRCRPESFNFTDQCKLI